MRTKLFLSTLAMFAVIVTGCASQTTQTQPALDQSTSPASVLPLETATQPPADVPGEATPAPVATSRGDQLVATDPSTVNLASGKPTLLEFFRFT